MFLHGRTLDEHPEPAGLDDAGAGHVARAPPPCFGELEVGVGLDVAGYGPLQRTIHRGGADEHDLARKLRYAAAHEDVRARRRVREAARRQEEDHELVQEMAGKIRAFFPGCPPSEALVIARHTAARGSGRVGRSASGRALDEHALRLAVIASIRHKHTHYDKLLMRGLERSEARWAVQDKIEEVLSRWENPEVSNR